MLSLERFSIPLLAHGPDERHKGMIPYLVLIRFILSRQTRATRRLSAGTLLNVAPFTHAVQDRLSHPTLPIDDQSSEKKKGPRHNLTGHENNLFKPHKTPRK
jgi:hypothetical protein